MMQRMEKSYKEFLCNISGPIGRVAKVFLKACSRLFGLGVYCKNTAYDSRIFKALRPQGVLICSIGNLQVGGSGKTPFTIMLGKYLQAKGFTVTVISRGYRAKRILERPLVVSNRQGPLVLPDESGDEPYLIAQRVPALQVIACKDRVLAAEQAAKEGAEIILLDDGFQHRRLGRDVDIVILDASLPSEGTHLLPRGLLREDYPSLKRAHLVVINRLQGEEQFNALVAVLKQYTNVPVIGVTLEVAQICTDRDTVISSLASQKVALFCGIANPTSFVHTLESTGAQIIAQDFYADHAELNAATIMRFAEKARLSGADYLVCTEKDAVKVRSFAHQLCLPLAWLKMDMHVQFANQAWTIWLDETFVRRKA